MARKHKLQKIQITNWSVNKEKLIEKRKISHKTQMIRKGSTVLNQEIELQVLDSGHVHRNHGFCFYTQHNHEIATNKL